LQKGTSFLFSFYFLFSFLFVVFIFVNREKTFHTLQEFPPSCLIRPSQISISSLFSFSWWLLLM